jgi:hypothetical protein
MGKRSKDKTKMEYVGSKDRILEDMASRKQQVCNMERTMSKGWFEQWRKEHEAIKDHPIYKHIRDLQDAAHEMGVSSTVLAWTHDPFLVNSFQTSIAVPMDFQSTLTDGQITSLLPVMNEFVFVEAQSLESVKQWLRCEMGEPVPVTNNRYLALMLSVMSENGMICSNWAQVAGNRNVFCSKATTNKTSKTLTASNLTTSLGRLRTTDNERIIKRKTIIENMIRGVKG